MLKVTNDLNILVEELNKLCILYNSITSENRPQYDAKMRSLVNKLAEITMITYDSINEHYSNIRGHKPNETEIFYMNRLLEMVRDRVKNGKLGDTDGKASILDVGTAYGRDLRYLSHLRNIKAVGIDYSQAFIEILNKLAANGEIPKDSYYKMDMTKMKDFDDAIFDAVRHNASLLHIPMLPNRIGADEAIEESFRVLRQFGLLYVLVKAGQGLKCTDTGEGLGARVYQYYTNESLTKLLERNGFRILETYKRVSQRPNRSEEWLIFFAEKIG